jgi:hypothetical protein
LAEKESQDLSRLRTKRHAHANLVSTLRNSVCENSVNADCGEQKRGACEQRQRERGKLGLRGVVEQFAAERNAQELCIRYVSGPRNQKIFPSSIPAKPATIRIDNFEFQSNASERTANDIKGKIVSELPFLTGQSF